MVPSPTQEVSASTAERPGSLNNGRIILTIIVPKNSNKPKFNRRGSNRPANRKIVNRKETSPSGASKSPPVSSLQITSGPIWKMINTEKTAPTIRVIVQNIETLNRLLINELFFGINKKTSEPIAAMNKVIRATQCTIGSSTPDKRLANHAIGILTSPPIGSGIIKRMTPAIEGRRNKSQVNKLNFFK